MKIRLLLFGLLLIFISSNLKSQTKASWEKLHYLSEEEMITPLTNTRNFTPTDPPEGEIRNVGEFDPMQGVLIRYPFGIPMSLIKAMAEETTVLTIVANSSQQATVTTQYQNNGVNLENCDFLLKPTDSYWVRDYGPWYVFDGNGDPGIVDFPYNRPRPNDNEIPIEMADYLGIDLYGMNLISTGGNYMCTGKGIAASTDLVWEENPSLTHDEVSGYVNDYLGNPLYDVTSDPLGEYIKHIDCWSKYLTPGKILIGQVSPSDPRYQDYEDLADHFATSTSSYGKPWEVIRVFTPGDPPYTPYTNSLILNDRIFVPITGSQWDDEAIDVYEEAMPGYDIVPILYNGWENTDALHCRAKGIADIGMLYIDHMPIYGSTSYHPEYNISAKITAHSGADIYSDSVLVYYKRNSGDFISTLMELDSIDHYSTKIVGVEPGDTVSYYIYAADDSGRQSMQPFVGEDDPFVFRTIYFPVNELIFDPDTVMFMNITDMIEGIPLNIINDISDKVTLTSLTEFGWIFPWSVEEMPVLPYELESGDILTLNIICAIPVSRKGEIVIDTMFIETLLESYIEIIAIDGDLTTGINLSISDNVNVYPNPFSNYFNVSIANPVASNVSIQVFDIMGKKVVDMENVISVNTPVIKVKMDNRNNFNPGTYFYKVVCGSVSKTGRIILAD